MTINSAKPRRPDHTLRSYALAAIRDKILSQELAPGERVNETTLAQELDISRGIVREALNQVLNEGLLQYTPHRGVHVTVLTSDDIRTLFAVRIVLEAMACRAIIDQGVQLDAAHELEKRAAEVADDLELAPLERIRRSLAFHETLLEFAHNDLAQRLWAQVASLSVALSMRPTEEGLTQLGVRSHHLPIVDALSRGNADEAVRVLTEHLEAGRDRYIESLAHGEADGSATAR